MSQHDKMDTEADIPAEESDNQNSGKQAKSDVEAMDCGDTAIQMPATSPKIERKTSHSKIPDAMKIRLRKIHYQLGNGCGRFKCSNPDCASHNVKREPLSKEQVIGSAIKLLAKPTTQICDPIVPVTVASVRELVKKAEETDDVSSIVKFCYKTFSDPDILDQSFRFGKDSDDKKNAISGAIATEKNSEIDYKALDEAYELLVLNENFTEEQTDRIQGVIRNAITTLSDLLNHSKGPQEPHHLRKYVILLLNPMFNLFERYDAFKKVCKAVEGLSSEMKDIMVEWFTAFDEERFENILSVLQQYITLKWINQHPENAYREVAPAVAVLDILHRANLRTKYLEFTTFYNDAINERYKYYAQVDYERKNGQRRPRDFSFADYDFVLDAAAKSQLLQIDATDQMNKEARDAVMQGFFGHGMLLNSSPYLILRIHRNNLINDALTQLQRRDGKELKKPLKVKFVGEEGVDEGGVQKEFFQLIIRRLFQPDYGMFECMEDTRLYWFNRDAFETPAEFELIGIVLGLAVYNGVILDIHFPKVVFKKLINKGYKATIDDIEEFKPDIVANFRKLLAFEGDVENTFCLNFAIEYMLYGEKKVVELKEDGANIPLTKENREEYVELYIDYIINKSITRQFGAFYEGFHDVCGGEYFEKFNWEELVLLICGSDDLDFQKLQDAARYDDGFEESSDTIKNFWSVIHELDEENKKKFLFFCTGSDRVPIRGLGDLVITISKNGVDKARLPTAHTCFNHLLLPDYPSKPILKERLLKAIQNSEGFGLL